MTNMKIPKTEFKNIIKECLKELINEGALDHMVGGMVGERAGMVQQQVALNDPRVRMAAMASGGGNPQQTQLMEQIFADAALNSLPQQMRNEQPNMMNFMNNATAGGQPQYYPQEQDFSSHPQAGFGRNPLPPRDPQAMQQQQRQGGPASRWAGLAFNSPISNRPSQGPGGVNGFLPGSSKAGGF